MHISTDITLSMSSTVTQGVPGGLRGLLSHSRISHLVASVYPVTLYHLMNTRLCTLLQASRLLYLSFHFVVRSVALKNKYAFPYHGSSSGDWSCKSLHTM